MSKLTSFYLDVLRLFAALGVFVSHCNSDWFSHVRISPDGLGHKLVIVFFVLSGYVIAFTTEIKENNLKVFLINRFSRLYSVIVPALALTYVIDNIGIASNPQYYVQFLNNGHYNFRYLITLLNFQELWGLSSKVSTNAPFWSIAFEFWYYIIFGVFVFVKKKPVKWTLIVFLLLIIGYKIILLFPIWILGVVIFRLNKKIRISYKITSPLIVLSLIVLFCYFFDIFQLPLPVYFDMGKAPLFFASDFLNDYFLALLIALNIFLVGSTTGKTNVNSLLDKSVKNLASATFALYLLHYPIIVFIAGVIPYDKENILQVSGLMMSVFGVIYIISFQIEKKRKLFKVFFTNLLNYSYNKVYRFL